MGNGGSIDRDNRESLAFGRTVAHLGTMSILVVDDDAPMQADGVTAFTISDGGEADLSISVIGNVRATDGVYYDQNGDNRFSADEALDVDDGVASGTFRLEESRSATAVWLCRMEKRRWSVGTSRRASPWIMTSLITSIPVPQEA